MRAGRKYKRWTNIWRQSALGAPQGIEPPQWLTFEEYYHHAFLGPAQLRELFVDISLNRRSHVKGCLLQANQPGSGSVLRIDAKYIHNGNNGIPRVHVSVMSEQGMLLSHVMLDTDNCSDLQKMVEGLALQYRGREQDLKVVYLDRGCCASAYKTLFGRINPAVELRLDLFHWERRIEQYVRKYHPIRAAFFSALRQCVFSINSDDEARVFDAIRSSGRWVERLTRREYSRYVRKTIPSPDILCPRLDAFYDYYRQLNEQLRPTGEHFLLEGFEDQWSENRTHAVAGCLSDHPGVNLYARAGEDVIGDTVLPVWRTSRSTSQLEGYHASLSKACKGSRLGPDLVNAIVHESAANWNRRALASRGSDVCPITDMKEWGEFQDAMGSLIPGDSPLIGQYQRDHEIKHLDFGLDYAFALHGRKLLEHVTQENAEAMVVIRSTKEQPSSSSSSTTVPATANFDNIDSEPLDGDELDIESWGLGEEDDLVDVDALAEIMCSTGAAEAVGGPKEDLRRQAVKFRGSIFKVQSPLANARSASLFRELNKKYNCLGITDRSVRIWADFELQRNIESQNYSASPGVLPARERITKTSITWCMKALRQLETSEDGKNVSGGGPVVERVDFEVEGREFQYEPAIGSVRVNDADNTDGEDAEALLVDTTPATREKLWRDTALEIQRMMRLKLLHVPRGAKTCSNCAVPFQVPASADIGVLATTQSHPCIQGHRMYRYCPLTTHPEVNGFLSLEDYKRLILPQKQLKTQARKRAKEEALCSRCGEPLADTHRPLSSNNYTVYWCPSLDGSRWTFEKWRDTPGLGPRRLAMVERNAAGGTKRIRTN